MALVTRPEIALLLCGARTTALADPANAAQMQTLAAGPLDWAEVLALAQAQGVLPLVWAAVEAACRDAVPPEVRAKAEAEVQTNARRNLFFTRALVNVIGLLAAQGLAVLPYKGPVLAAQVYGRPSLRQFADLDILVPGATCQRCGRTCWRRRSSLARGRPPPAKNAPPRYEIQLHPHSPTRAWRWSYTDMTPNYSGSHRRREARAHRQRDAWRRAPTFGPAWQLLSLCVHGANHCWLKLSQVAMWLRWYGRRRI
jgi:hypothetical protein